MTGVRRGSDVYVRVLRPALDIGPGLARYVAPYPGVHLGHNELTPGFSTLVARLCLQASEPGGGITYCAAGTGDPGWDTSAPPAPTGEEVQLASEIARKAFSAAYFVDSLGTPRTVDEAVSEQLNTIDFEVVFGVGEAVGSICELGLWGGDASAVLGSGTLVNYETIAAIPKPSQAELAFVFRFSF